MTAAFLAAVFLLIALSLPPARREATGLSGEARVRGAFHVHTVRSDGGGTRDDVARAAAAAGLDFVILTDHGDGTRAPDAPEYLQGVLVIDGVEITTARGHYAAFGLSQAPYPLGGPPRPVVEDVERLGGFGVAAHPDSAKTGLRWQDWSAPVGGIEVINGDSAWRDEPASSVARALAGYLWRPGPALAGLIEPPSRMLERLDASDRRVVALAGVDAHARLPLWTGEDASPWALRVPSYEAGFRTFANIVHLAEPFSGNAAEDAVRLTRAIRDARVVIAMSALAGPADLDFTASTVGGPSIGRYPAGSAVIAQPLVFEARASDVVEDGQSLVRLRLVRDGALVVESSGPALSHRVDMDASSGAWRIEGFLAHRPEIPWLLSNPIRVVLSEWARPNRLAFPDETLELTGGPWVIEKQPASTAAVQASDAGVVFDYALAGGAPSGQYGAAVRNVAGEAAWSHVVLRARANEPTRLWVQLRLNDSASGQRWGRSVYLDRHSREVTLGLDEFIPLEPGGARRRPHQATVRAVLLVVDTVNSAPGRAGQISVERLALERRPGAGGEGPAPGSLPR